MKRAIPLVALMLLAATSCAKRPEPVEEEIEAVEIGYGGDDYCDYVRCDESEADWIILLEIYDRDGGTPSRHRFPLKFNPNGKIRGVGCSGNRWFACGGAGGANGSVSLRGHDGQQDHVTASVSYSWSNAAGQSGKGEGDISVPWMGTARRAIGGGITVRVSFVLRV